MISTCSENMSKHFGFINTYFTRVHDMDTFEQRAQRSKAYRMDLAVGINLNDIMYVKSSSLLNVSGRSFNKCVAYLKIVE